MQCGLKHCTKFFLNVKKLLNVIKRSSYVGSQQQYNATIYYRPQPTFNKITVELRLEKKFKIILKL